MGGRAGEWAGVASTLVEQTLKRAAGLNGLNCNSFVALKSAKHPLK